MDRLLNLAYHWATQNMDGTDRRKFDAQLWMPPPGEVPVQGPWTAEAETQAFAGFAAAITGGRQRQGAAVPAAPGDTMTASDQGSRRTI